MLTYEDAVTQVSELLQVQTGLSVSKSSEEEIQLSGALFVNRVYRDFPVRKHYRIKLVIPVGSEELPYVLDTENQIDNTYPHAFTGKKLCLETPTSIRIQYIDGFNLVSWVQNYVEVYFFTYEYYKRYGIYPFGERAHGYCGIVQTYKDLLHIDNEINTIHVMKYISTVKVYRGHHRCPCGSNKRIRSCHGEYIKPIYEDCRLRKILDDDLLECYREAKEGK